MAEEPTTTPVPRSLHQGDDHAWDFRMKAGGQPEPVATYEFKLFVWMPDEDDVLVEHVVDDPVTRADSNTGEVQVVLPWTLSEDLLPGAGTYRIQCRGGLRETICAGPLVVLAGNTGEDP